MSIPWSDGGYHLHDPQIQHVNGGDQQNSNHIKYALIIPVDSNKSTKSMNDPGQDLLNEDEILLI